MTRSLLVLVALGICLGSWAQGPPAPGAPPAAPEVDRTDPAAVVRAYVDACQRKDVEGAVALVVGDQAGVVRFMVQMLGEEAGRGGPEGFDFRSVFTEIGLLPLGKEPGAPEAVETELAPAEGGMAVVVAEPAPRKRIYVLKPAENGEWSIDLDASMTRTTGQKASFVFTQMRQDQQRGNQTATREDWRVQQHMSRLLIVLTRYIGEHGNRVPDAANWMDEVEKYSMDPAILRRPGVAKGEYGYALNAAIAGQPLPQDWDARQAIVLIYETDDLQRNASGDPDAEEAERPADAPARWMGMAGGNVRSLPKGVAAGALEQAGKDYDTCQQHMSMVAEALLAYAREHDGVLPPAASWCDEIGPYLKPEANTPDLWRCPATPDLQFGYAINAEIAGTDVRILEGHESYVLLLHANSGEINEGLQLPAKAVDCPHMARWGNQGKCTLVTMLSLTVTNVGEGEPFPQPPVPGREE